MPEPTFFFAGGGTGGHLFPGLAVAAAVQQLEPSARIVFLTTSRTLDRDLLSRSGYQQIEQRVQPYSPNPLKWPAFWLAWRGSVSAARALIRKHSPRAVLGLGGYAAGPAVVAARRSRVKAGILNPDAVPGRANQYLARYADVVVLQWEASRSNFPPATACESWGCPIREQFSPLARALAQALARGETLGDATAVQEMRPRFGLAMNRRVLLVTGASQGARSINETMLLVWPRFWKQHPEWQLLHLTGVADEGMVRAGYEKAELPRDATRVLAFTHEMWHAIGAANIVVSRAGASTLAELSALGRASVLLPYPYHRDRHQHANAQVLVDAGAAILVDDTKVAAQNAGPLLAALERLAINDERTKLATAARSLGRPDAAERVARWMVG
jgi:UDP-N-acetylglucosamine--N-acetylmuramyl-(pentapeptide) pyrophosphoryl-undecaprenol N-acetylglucosamine transferase